jgi:trehalose-6-phosphatase
LIQIRKLVVVDMAGQSDCRDVFPVYIGDDGIDEDAFKTGVRATKQVPQQLSPQ